ncbi:MAG: hypothetical protein CVT89_07550 [Candidatus Altiarchaeales archaeon HGW-Altiarchaeales-2]|nr:MAG: hypothetical protein CVT89_07550 [Candidatus Altiarchaeales archaeon HGW-Altiarchaeales-2]
MGAIYLNEGIESLIRMNIYKDVESVMKDAFRALLELKPSLKIEYAIDIYKNKKITLWAAAEKAGISMEEFKEILAARGIRVEVSSSKEESDKRHYSQVNKIYL